MRRLSALRLALFAMLVQLVATYGHLHPEDFYRLMPGDGAAVTVASAPALPHGQTGLADDADCPLCQSLQMLGGTALPDAVALRPPSLSAAPRAIARAPWRFSPAPRPPFQTRAPPIA